MTLEVLLTCLFIVLCRIADVTLGTMRTIMVVRGRKHLSVLLGFAEVFIWIMIVTKVVKSFDGSIIYTLAYAGGFALGNYIGMTVDEWLALGEQATMVLSKKGSQIAGLLRERGWRVTELEGHGRDSATTVLLLVAPRRKATELQQHIQELDPNCFYTVEDVRLASSLAARTRPRQGIASLLVGK